MTISSLSQELESARSGWREEASGLQARLSDAVARASEAADEAARAHAAELAAVRSTSERVLVEEKAQFEAAVSALKDALNSTRAQQHAARGRFLHKRQPKDSRLHRAAAA